MTYFLYSCCCRILFYKTVSFHILFLNMWLSFIRLKLARIIFIAFLFGFIKKKLKIFNRFLLWFLIWFVSFGIDNWMIWILVLILKTVIMINLNTAIMLLYIGSSKEPRWYFSGFRSLTFFINSWKNRLKNCFLI